MVIFNSYVNHYQRISFGSSVISRSSPQLLHKTKKILMRSDASWDSWNLGHTMRSWRCMGQNLSEMHWLIVYYWNTREFLWKIHGTWWFMGMILSGWWFGTWLDYCSIYWKIHNPNWRTLFFQRGWNHQPCLLLNYLLIVIIAIYYDLLL